MDPPPELERIIVDTPPPSPISFTEDSFDSIETQEVVSPVKKVKRARTGPVNQSKRRKKNDAPIFEPGLNDSVQEFYDSSNEPLVFDEAPLGGYPAYVVGVVERLAGFYPLSHDLYVVQGWDDKLNCAKVIL
jgi:hypothetical protein